MKTMWGGLAGLMLLAAAGEATAQDPGASAPVQYEVSFANVPAGKYDYICTPHIATGMKGSVTVQ